jgi:hypothetical protein
MLVSGIGSISKMSDPLVVEEGDNKDEVLESITGAMRLR